VAQVPLLHGITTTPAGDFQTTYPVNLVPVPKDTGISKGYLQIAPGITQMAQGHGSDRGAWFVASACYRVSGGSLIRVGPDGSTATIGVLPGTGMVAMDYSNDRACFVTSGQAFYGAANVLTKITDPNIGSPIDVIWVDGYFMFTDGTFIYVSDLNDPYTIDPLKYAASDIDPDAVLGLEKYRNEVYVFNRYTIEVFNNVGSAGFPFVRLPGGLIPKGCVGTFAKCLFAETLAWVGGARGENNSVYMANGATAEKIATRDIERIIGKYTDEDLFDILVESKTDKANVHLYIHLPEETLVYDAAASAALGERVWFVMSTGVDGIAPYRARGFVYAYGKWIVGDREDGRIGYIDDTVATQYEEIAGWQFETALLYNASKGAQVHSLELVGTMGRGPDDDRRTIWTSYSVDGETWSDEKAASMGARGDRLHRAIWRRQGFMRNFRGQRFRGANVVPGAIVRLEAEFEALSA
jgi:hypothetical protein